MSGAGSDPVVFEAEGAVGLIRFDRPDALNALDRDTIHCLHDVLLAADARQDIRCVVLQGAGRAFMAGGDLGYLARAADDAPAEASVNIDALNQAMLVLSSLSKPTLASLHGAVAGAGFSLALACDLAIAASNARFVYAYSAIAASPDGGMSRALPRVVGMRKALEIAYLPGPIDAGTALALGLVNRVVEPADLESATRSLAGQIAAGPTLALVRTRKLMQDSWATGLADQLEAERQAFCASAATADMRGAIRAFFERRPAEFRGE